MTINSNNFEAYLLDYLEGNLDPLLTADLMAFLAENPDYERYIPEYDSNLSLSQSLVCPQKNSLKKEFADVPEITPDNFDEFCIASCEGMLDKGQVSRLSGYIALHPDKQRDLDLYRILKLKPDTDLQFPGKEKLKKYRFIPFNRNYVYYTLGIAASLTLILLLVTRKPAGPVYTESIPVRSGQSVTITYPVPRMLELSQRQAAPVATEPHPVTRPVSTVTIPALTDLVPKSCMKILPAVNPPQISEHLAVAVPRIPLKEPLQELPSDESEKSRLGILLSRLDFWKAAEKAVTGFNYLTEARLSVEKTTTDDGKFAGLLIGVTQ
jgi:hypothetical protein